VIGSKKGLSEEEQKRIERIKERNRQIIDQHVQMQTEEFQSYVAQTSDHSLNFPVSKSDSVYLWDAYGNSFLDFTAGIGVNNIGNRNFVIMSKIKEQLDHYTHTMVYGEHLQLNQIEYAKAISGYFPSRDDFPQQVFFVNSGNEAIDLALKMSRKVSGKKGIVSMERGFHGRGYGAMQVTWNDNYKKGFFVDDEATVFLKPGGPIPDQYEFWGDIGTVILELVQGEAGCIPLSKIWVQKLLKIAKAHSVLVIIDEIQTGYGRTGTFLAQEQYEVEADITCLGKAGGGGLPFGAVVSSRTNFELLQTPNLSHLTTFGGNPVVMAAGLAVIEYIQEELLSHVQEMGKYLTEQVTEVAKSYPKIIKGSQGIGLMQGLILNDDEHGPEFTERFYKECLMRGLLLHFKLNNPYVLRMTPPLIISDRSIKEACDIFVDVCMELESSDN